ncbi:MAG: GNAT family N-acetyltransferase, partial [Candidatus Didemnitutus sp.]|nr:GNAT family N-acetyltransferase [Candidatus Didemnitutus sp.]
IGTDLLGALLQEFREASIHTVWLTVHPENRAVHLYERHGFGRVAEHENYFGPNEPRLRLRLNLTA